MMSTAEQIEALVLKELEALLARHGFTRLGSAYHREMDDVAHLISLQRSRKSSSERTLMAVNLGVAAKNLLGIESARARKIRIEDCHWRIRLGPVESMDEYWWILKDDDSAHRAALEIGDALLRHGLPQLDSLSNEQALCGLWSTGRSPGLTEAERLLNLTALLRMHGPPEQAAAALELLKQAARIRPLPVIVEYLRDIGESI